MGSSLLCVTVLALLAGGYGQPCTLITPSVLHRDSDETIVLDGHNTAFEAEVQIQDFPRRNLQLSRQKISLNDDNNFLGTATVRIPSKDLAKDPKSKQYVYVTVTSPVCSLEKVVLLGHQSGYAFIQTDKTIYTPGSNVFYRIFSMDNKMSPVNKPMVVDILTPENTISRRETVKSAGIISSSYKLPELMSEGVWTISVRSEDSPLQLHSTSFEVKEYVLPRYEMQLIPEKKFHNVDNSVFKFKIKANSLYGEPVDGLAFVTFGITKDGTRTSLHDTTRGIPINGGEGQAVLKTEDLVKNFTNPDDLLQYTLYMSVTLITDSEREIVESKLEDIALVKYPYKVHFTKTSKYFKPGLPFDLLVHVTNPDGSPAERVPVVAEPGRVKGITGAEGTARLTLNTAADTDTFTTTVRTSDPSLPPTRQASASMTANAHQSGGNYLHIGVTPSEVKPGDNLAVNLLTRNNNAEVQNQIQHFTYLITTKGRIVTVGRKPRLAGQSVVTLSLPITEDLIPSFRIIAYYIIGNKIVSDSMRMDVSELSTKTVWTSDPSLPPTRQTSASMTANAHQSGGNYLHIGVTPSEVKPGDNLAVNLLTRNNNAEVQNQIQHFTYLITTKGRIVNVGRKPRLAGQSVVTMSLPITEDLIPSFRIIAYYIIGNKIVSDSMRMDVSELSTKTLQGATIQSPGSSMDKKLQADHMASVDLGAMEKVLHELNSKFKISHKKMMDSVEKSDTGCTPGGGADSMGVFYDAGLALQSTLQSTPQRSEQYCEERASRVRRSSDPPSDQKNAHASSSQEMVRRCCIDGMNEKGENCEGRAANIWEGRECADAFLDCCKFIRQKKVKERNPTEPDAETRVFTV
ncbi:venom factor-like [Engystomops pustulosus]|uniref:venom factor-like n=1 Tax=Engystomops pustulosus TaxID=76066 RepID=UPI003AFA092D